MCTVTALPGDVLAAGPSRMALRLVFSRDERRARRAALPPSIVGVDGRRVLMPVDAEAGGTWVAASDAGLVFALLNVTDHVSPGRVSRAPAWPGRATRGAIIPSLAGATSLDEVAARAGAIDPTCYAPFSLLCTCATGRLEVRSNGRTLSAARHADNGPWLRTSSSLGDRRVIEPRRRLFHAWFRRPPFDRVTQDGFHRHWWPAHRELSVLMDRPDACTVSITTVEIGPDGPRMSYVTSGPALSSRKAVDPP
jgi:hypothetical protein